MNIWEYIYQETSRTLISAATAHVTPAASSWSEASSDRGEPVSMEFSTSDSSQAEGGSDHAHAQQGMSGSSTNAQAAYQPPYQSTSQPTSGNTTRSSIQTHSMTKFSILLEK